MAPSDPVWENPVIKKVKVMADLTDTWSYTIRTTTIPVTGAYNATQSNGKLTGSEAFLSDKQQTYYGSWQCLSAFSLTESLLFESSLVPGKIEVYDLGTFVSHN
jgi:hypothetical protein